MIKHGYPLDPVWVKLHHSYLKLLLWNNIGDSPQGSHTQSDDVIRDSPQFGNSLSKSSVITDLRKGCFPILRQIGRLTIRAGLPAGDCLVTVTIFYALICPCTVELEHLFIIKIMKMYPCQELSELFVFFRVQPHTGGCHIGVPTNIKHLCVLTEILV